jgi:hypothetical protein
MHTEWDAFQRRKIMLISLCFLAGTILIVILAIWLPPSEPALVEVSPLDESEGNDRQIVNVIILGADDLLAAPTALEAVWIGTFNLVRNDGILLGLPRSFNLANGLSVEQAFAWSQENKLDPGFVFLFEETLALDFDAVVVVDRDCFQAGIDFIGGIPMETGHHLNGSAALALQALSADDPWAALEIQAEILAGVEPQMEALGALPDLTPLLYLIPQHCWLSISEETALDMLLDMLPMDEGSIQVETIANAD